MRFLDFLPTGVALSDLGDNGVTILIGLALGLARELYDTYQCGETTSVQEMLARTFIGGCVGFLGGEFTNVVMGQSDFTWVSSGLFAWSGGSILDKLMSQLESRFKEPITSTSMTTLKAATSVEMPAAGANDSLFISSEDSPV